MGAGSSGGGAEAAEYYLKLGHNVVILKGDDQRDTDPMMKVLSEKGAQFVSKSDAQEIAGNADLVVKTPGVPVPYLLK